MYQIRSLNNQKESSEDTMNKIRFHKSISDFDQLSGIFWVVIFGLAGLTIAFAAVIPVYGLTISGIILSKFYPQFFMCRNSKFRLEPYITNTDFRIYYFNNNIDNRTVVIII